MVYKPTADWLISYIKKILYIAAANGEVFPVHLLTESPPKTKLYFHSTYTNFISCLTCIYHTFLQGKMDYNCDTLLTVTVFFFCYHRILTNTMH